MMPPLGIAPPVPGEACKMITVVLADDGTDLALMRALRTEKGVIRANSTSCFGSSILAEAKTRPGKLPEPMIVRRVEILVAEADVDEIFEFACQHADMGHPDGGVVFQSAAPFCTPYVLPEGVPDEPSLK